MTAVCFDLRPSVTSYIHGGSIIDEDEGDDIIGLVDVVGAGSLCCVVSVGHFS
ncbi:MAG TPA: hypothetical protein VE130_03375 [Nitrososphaeraceae archaeon]|jgi:hypothetical protein|nr:hypothetical protein [Nitrososphaeraceae archaeon]